jgi:adenosylcobinamide-GDP ribazoletransferase
VVGAAIGAALGGLWWSSSKVWPAGVAAALVVVGDLALTGMLHLDGLVDAADGLLPPLSRERRLMVMREPGVGAFGVATGASALLLRWAALAALRPSVVLLGGVWALSRTAMAIVLGTVPYARQGTGLASGFLEPGHAMALGRADRVPAVTPSWWRVGAVGIAIGLAGVMAWRTPQGLAVVAAEVVGACAVVGLGIRRIGGFTGDVLGAAGVVAETSALLVAAVRW